MRKICLSLLLAAVFLGTGCSGCKNTEETSQAAAEDQKAAEADASLTENENKEEKPAAAEQISANVQTVSLEIQGSLEGSLRKTLDDSIASPLSQVTARMLVWWVDMARDLRKGDTISIAYELQQGREPLLHAVRFSTGKFGKTFRAYRFMPSGQPFAHFFDETGKEIEETLKDGPIDNYDQITSILKDGRNHKGVDFRAPTGTPVKMPFDGTLSRKNWKFRGNGNCLDFMDSKGRHIIFLHLEEISDDLKVGQRFKKGTVVAKSGNSGRSYAPHLHYQLEDSKGKILDPFEVHETYRKTIPDADRAAFDAVVQRYDQMLNKNPQ